MKSHLTLLFAILSIFAGVSQSPGQVDSVIGQATSSIFDSFAGGMSGNARFVVFESRGDVATVNPRNADNNLEIFLWDYAQRRIFQITDTKSVLTDAVQPPTFGNIKVDLQNTRPVISTDGRWIAFTSNATTSTPAAPNATNPGNLDGNAVPLSGGVNPLTLDANLEVWLYQIPAYTPVADLSAGDELPLTDLAGGAFTQVTNTTTSILPRPGTTTTQPFIAEDNHDPSINDDGNVIAFVSNRDLVPAVGNGSTNANDEIFTYVRTAAVLGQVTLTPRGTIGNPIYNRNPSISGTGTRLVFASTGENPIVGMTGGSNPESSRNEEVYFTELDATGTPTGNKKQLTTTTPAAPGDPVNRLDHGKRISRDGRFVAFDSYADLAGSSSIQPGFALYLFDLNNPAAPVIKQIGPRSDADTAASGGDVAHFPGFTDNDANGTPATLVLETRLNIKPDGTIPATASEGLNPDPGRPVQIYSYPINVTTGATFKRLTKFPVSNTFLASVQPLPSDTAARMSFSLALTELGTGNFDFQSEIFYLLNPQVINQSAVNVNFATGASRMAISPSPVPTPSPTATPTPSPSPSPAPSPTPQTPPAVHGISPGLLTIMNFDAGFDQPIIARTAVGGLDRSFQLPMELSGLTMTINGVTVGLKSVSRHTIVFVAPMALASTTSGTSYPIVINNNGTVMKNTVTVVPARPDIFTDRIDPGPGGRAKLFNVTNRVRTTEPFTVTTYMLRGGKRVPSVMRLYATGIANTTSAVFTIRIGSISIQGNTVLTGGIPAEPGVYTIDFLLPSTLNGAGDQPIILTITAGGITFTSRLDDTAPRVRIL